MMRNLLFAACGAAMFAGACASTKTVTTSEVSEPPVIETAAETIDRIAPPAVDASGDTSWFAVEKLWPDEPYMGMVNAAQTDSETWGLSFSCNVDTGELTGHLDFQPINLTGESAMFTLDTGNGQTYALPGAYAEGGAEGSALFQFAFDWLKMKDLTETSRAVFMDDDDIGVMALVTPAAENRGDAQILASLEGLDASQAKFYYFCNPK